MSELLACPWCENSGDELSIIVHESDDPRFGQLYQGQIECRTCGARGPQTAWYSNRESAETMVTDAPEDHEQWNKRPAIQSAVAQREAAIIKWLRGHQTVVPNGGSEEAFWCGWNSGLKSAADAIERGDHR